MLWLCILIFLKIEDSTRFFETHCTLVDKSRKKSQWMCQTIYCSQHLILWTKIWWSDLKNKLRSIEFRKSDLFITNVIPGIWDMWFWFKPKWYKDRICRMNGHWSYPTMNFENLSQLLGFLFYCSEEKSQKDQVVTVLDHCLHNHYESPPLLDSWLILWSQHAYRILCVV